MKKFCRVCRKETEWGESETIEQWIDWKVDEPRGCLDCHKQRVDLVNNGGNCCACGKKVDGNVIKNGIDTFFPVIEELSYTNLVKILQQFVKSKEKKWDYGIFFTCKQCDREVNKTNIVTAANEYKTEWEKVMNKGDSSGSSLPKNQGSFNQNAFYILLVIGAIVIISLIVYLAFRERKK